jgi:hypothetical protein
MSDGTIAICASAEVKRKASSAPDLTLLGVALDRINRGDASSVSSVLELTPIGFQGILSDPAPIRRMLLHLEAESGLKLRFGIATGSMADGSAALAEAEFTGAFPVAHRGFTEPECQILNATAYAVLAGMRKATVRQREAVESFDSLGREVSVAEEMGISQPAVNKMLKSADGRSLLKSADAYVGFLSSLLTQHRPAWG